MSWLLLVLHGEAVDEEGESAVRRWSTDRYCRRHSFSLIPILMH